MSKVVDFAFVITLFALLASAAHAYDFGNFANIGAVDRSLLINSWRFPLLSSTREVNFTFSVQQLDVNVDRFNGRVEVVKVEISPRNLLFKFGDDTTPTAYIVMKNLSANSLPPASVIYQKRGWHIAHIGNVAYFNFGGNAGYYFDRVDGYSIHLAGASCPSQPLSIFNHNLLGGAPTPIPRAAEFSLIELNNSLPAGQFRTYWNTNGFNAVRYSRYDSRGGEWNSWREIATGFTSPYGSKLANFAATTTRIKYIYSNQLCR